MRSRCFRSSEEAEAIDSTGLCLSTAFPALDIPERLASAIEMINARYGITLTGDDGGRDRHFHDHGPRPIIARSATPTVAP